MAAPPSKDPSRLGKGPSSHPNPPGAGAFLTTPSTTTDTGYASSLLMAGSAQSGGGLSSARANIYPASSRYLRHSGLGDIINRGSLLTAPKVPVRILTSGGQNQYQPIRADPPGLHAGSDISLSTMGVSSDYPHFTPPLPYPLLLPQPPPYFYRRRGLVHTLVMMVCLSLSTACHQFVGK